MVNDNNKFSQLCRPRHCGRGDKKRNMNVVYCTISKKENR